MTAKMTHGTSRRFALWFCAGFAALWCAVVAVHVLGNPDNMFPSPLSPTRSNRAWKSRRVDALIADGQAPQIVILGSSRMMQVSPAIVQAITGKRTFNYSAVGASPREYKAQLLHLLERGCKPDMLIVGIDERSMFGHYHRWDGRMVEDWLTLRHADWLDAIPRVWQAITQIKFARTPEAIQGMFVEIPLDPESLQSVHNFLCGDGYRVRRQESIQRKRKPWKAEERRETLRLHAEAEAVPQRARFAAASIEADQKTDVLDLLRLARQNRIEVKLIITPMQPDYSLAVQSDRSRKRMQQYVAELRNDCRILGVELYDFRNLDSFKGADYEFWDEQHPTPFNTIRMMNTIFGLKPNTRHPGVPDDMALISNPPAVSTLNAR